MEISDYAIDESFILSNYNVQVEGKYIYLPIYMIMFIDNNDISFPKTEFDDLSLLS